MRIFRVSVLFRLPVALLFLAIPAAAEQYAGTVYHDINGSGRLDSGEPGISGVPVSNGEEVVLSGASGDYVLPVNAQGMVFVIKPSGWTPPIDPETRLTGGHYLHRPGGSPEMKYGGIPPTGPLPDRIDFALRPQHEPDTFRVLCLGDTQTRDAADVSYLLHDLVAETAGIDVAFGVSLGDVVFDDLSVFDPMLRAIALIGAPWRYVGGNHDMDFDAPTWEQAFETFQRVFGPKYHAFAYGPAHFLVLNNIHWRPEDREYHCELGAGQLAFVRNYLAHVPKDRLVVALMHIPIMEARDKAALFGLLAEHPHTLSLSAHYHAHEHLFLDADDGWPGAVPHHHIINGTASGSWYRGPYDAVGIPAATMADGTPKGYSLLTVSGNRYELQYKATRRPAEYQMDIHAPTVVTRAQSGRAVVTVNFFNGSERCRLELRIADTAPWLSMEQFRGRAPFYVETHERQNLFLQLAAGIHGVDGADEQTLRRIEEMFRPAMGRGMPKPRENVGHLWRATLPSELPASRYLLEVRATDQFGHVHHGRRALVVE